MAVVKKAYGVRGRDRSTQQKKIMEVKHKDAVEKSLTSLGPF